MPIDMIPEAEARRLEEELDPEISFRKLAPGPGMLVAALLLVLSAFHYYTAGFGLLEETTHRGIHLAFVIGLIFLVFSFLPGHGKTVQPSTARPQRAWRNTVPQSPRWRSGRCHRASSRGNRRRHRRRRRTANG